MRDRWRTWREYRRNLRLGMVSVMCREGHHYNCRSLSCRCPYCDHAWRGVGGA